MNDCWYVLALAILATDYCTPEMAFINLGNGAIGVKNNALTDADFEDMLKLRKDHTYQEIADMYGTEMSCIFKRIKKFEKKVGKK